MQMDVMCEGPPATVASERRLAAFLFQNGFLLERAIVVHNVDEALAIAEECAAARILKVVELETDKCVARFTRGADGWVQKQGGD
jgi:hypothetical protein